MLNIGLLESEKTMLSTSTNYNVANCFSNSEDIHKIIVPAGILFLYLESHTKAKGEYESLLPFGCVFSDYKTMAGDGKTIIERTVLKVDDVDSLISDEFMDILRTKKTSLDNWREKARLEMEEIIETRLTINSKGKGIRRTKRGRGNSRKSKT